MYATPQRIYLCAHVHLPLIMLLRTATTPAFGSLCFIRHWIVQFATFASVDLKVLWPFQAAFSIHLPQPPYGYSLIKPPHFLHSLNITTSGIVPRLKNVNVFGAWAFTDTTPVISSHHGRFSKFLLQTRSVSVLLNCRMFSQKDPENENKRRRAAQTFVEGQLNCAFALFVFLERESEIGWLWSFLEERISSWRV